MATSWNKGWKPRGNNKTNAQAVLDFLEGLKSEGLLPVKNRTVFYHLVTRGLVEKTESGSETVNNLLTSMRSAGWIPPIGYLEDASAITPSEFWYSGSTEFVNNVRFSAEHFTMDRQGGQMKRLIFWLESSGHLAAVRSVADPFSIPVVTCSRQDSYDLKAQVAKYILTKGADTEIFHIGDLDGQGLCIFDALAETVPELVAGWNEMVGTDYKIPRVRVHRLALRNLDQVYELGLEYALGPAKRVAPGKQPGMNEKYGIFQTCEADAIPPRVVRDMARRVIDNTMDPHAYSALLEYEEAERDRLMQWIDAA